MVWKKWWWNKFIRVNTSSTYTTVNGRRLSDEEAKLIDEEIDAFFKRMNTDMQQTLDRIVKRSK